MEIKGWWGLRAVATVSWLLAERRAGLEGRLGGKALTALSRASGLLGTAWEKMGAVWEPHTRVFRRESVAALLELIIVGRSDLGAPCAGSKALLRMEFIVRTGEGAWVQHFRAEQRSSHLAFSGQGRAAGLRRGADSSSLCPWGHHPHQQPPGPSRATPLPGAPAAWEPSPPCPQCPQRLW